MRKYTTKFLKITQVKPGEHVVQVIYIENSGSRSEQVELTHANEINHDILRANTLF